MDDCQENSTMHDKMLWYGIEHRAGNSSVELTNAKMKMTDKWCRK